MIDNRLIAFRFPVALVLSIVCLAAPAWADFKAGEKAYQRADYATALREWQPLATKRHAGAQYYLGLLYTNGQGVPKDDAQARQWYEKAALQGHTDAQVNLGSLYDYGRGGPQDFKMAVRWYRRAADQGNSLAQRRLGLLYERVDSVTKDYVQAYMWYKLGAANGGNTGAMMRDELAIRMTSASSPKQKSWRESGSRMANE